MEEAKRRDVMGWVETEKLGEDRVAETLSVEGISVENDWERYFVSGKLQCSSCGVSMAWFC